MNEIKAQLIKRARETHREITPCGTKENLDDCFTVSDDRLLFWFNTEDKSTHLLVHDMA